MKTSPVVRRYLVLLAGAGFFAASGCSQQAALPVAAPAVRGPARVSGAPPVRRRTLPSQLLFLTPENGTIAIYPLSNPKSGPVATISGLIGGQQQIVVDSQGNLIVANNGASGQDDYIAEYAPPYDGAPTILNTVWQSALFYPVGAAVDSHGTLYVTDCGKYCSETPDIFVYPSGAKSPASVISSPQFDSMAGLSIDSHDNLYALEWNSSTFATDVYKIAAGTTTPKPLHLHGLSTGDGGNSVTLDAAGDVFVGNGNSGTNYILGFRPGAHNPYKIIDSMPFGTEPEMLTFGADGNLYVPANCPFPPCELMYAFHPHAGKAFESLGPSQSYEYAFGVATAPNLQLEGK